MNATASNAARVVYSRIDTTHNVEVDVDGTTVTFACLDKDHAKELARQINGCAWAQVASNDPTTLEEISRLNAEISALRGGEYARVVSENTSLREALRKATSA
jgi:hypothetical protein